MNFGDAEWFEELKRRVDFPSIIAFYVCSDKRVNSTIVSSKSGNIAGIQYKTLKPPILYGGTNAALANVLKCESPHDYYEECKRLMNIWEIEPKATEPTEQSQAEGR